MKPWALRIVVVIGAIAALIFAMFAVAAAVSGGLMIWSHRHQQRDHTALGLKTTAAAAGLFAERTGRCPNATHELVTSGLILSVPLDAWGREVTMTPTRAGVRFRSSGADATKDDSGSADDLEVEVGCARVTTTQDAATP